MKNEKIKAKLEELNIKYEYFKHDAAPTAEIASEIWKDIPGLACKNVFFRNHKGKKHYLVILPHYNSIAVRDLEQMLKQGKLSFASGWRLEKYLGTTAGAISPLGLVYDENSNTHVFIDSELKSIPSLLFHPNDNTEAVLLAHDDLITYIESCGNTYEYLDLST